MSPEEAMSQAMNGMGLRECPNCALYKRRADNLERERSDLLARVAEARAEAERSLIDTQRILEHEVALTRAERDEACRILARLGSLVCVEAIAREVCYIETDSECDMDGTQCPGNVCEDWECYRQSAKRYLRAALDKARELE